MTISDAMKKMIEISNGSRHDIDHFIKVWAYARTIGELEGLDKDTQLTLEYAAIVHDIACPGLRAEFGSCPGIKQQEVGGPMAREFFQDSDLPQEMTDRIVYLVEHHHTFKNVDGLDYQILLEADYLVNSGESEKYRRDVEAFRSRVFKTKTGLSLLASLEP